MGAGAPEGGGPATVEERIEAEPMKLSEEERRAHVARLDQAALEVSKQYSALFTDIAKADVGVTWRRFGYSSTADWVTDVCGLDLSMAEEWVATARRLRHLPVLAGTFEAGEIAMESVIEIARVATPERRGHL
jgi:hypothetical protein